MGRDWPKWTLWCYLVLNICDMQKVRSGLGIKTMTPFTQHVWYQADGGGIMVSGVFFGPLLPIEHCLNATVYCILLPLAPLWWPTWIRTFCVCWQVRVRSYSCHTNYHMAMAILPVRNTNTCTINRHHDIIHYNINIINILIFSFRWSGSVPNLPTGMSISLHHRISPLTGCITGLDIFYPSNCN